MASLPAARMLARRVPASLGIAVLALGFRVGSALLAFLANVAYPDYQREQFTVFGHTDLFWDALARYDSGWYFQIARFGYHYTPGGRDTIAFFPVYPLLMRHVGRLFGRAPSDLYLGGVVVSWLAFAIALIGLYKLAKLDLSSRRAGRAVTLAAVFPFAYFFGAVYTEATFFAAAIWAFYGFRTRQWLLGGVCGAIATATRVNGILMWPALAWIVYSQLRRSSPPATAAPDVVTTAGERGVAVTATRREWTLALVGLLLVPAGIAAYSLFVYTLSGNPLEWVATVQRWGYYPGGSPWLSLLRLAGILFTRPFEYLSGERMALYDTLNGVTGIVFVLSVPAVWYRFGAAYGLFMAANLWLPLSSGQYEGLGRYCSVLFPFFVLVGALPRALFLGTAVASAMLYMLCLSLFSNIHPLF